MTTSFQPSTHHTKQRRVLWCLAGGLCVLLGVGWGICTSHMDGPNPKGSKRARLAPPPAAATTAEITAAVGSQVVGSQAVAPSPALLLAQAPAASKATEKPAPTTESPLPVAAAWHVPASVHPWGNFQQGAWQSSRTVVVKQVGNALQNRTTTESRVTLQEKDARSVTLVKEALMSLLGKGVKMEPEQQQQDFFGLALSQPKTYHKLPSENLVVGGQPIPCEVVRVTMDDQRKKRELTIWYSTSRAPHIFRRTLKIWNAVTGQLEESSELNVTALNIQTLVLGKMLSAYQYTQETHSLTGGSRENAVVSTQVPGGIVSRQIHEYAINGLLQQTITTELLDYGLSATDNQRKAYYSGVTRIQSDRLPFVPQTMEGTGESSQMRRTEFAVEFTAPPPPAPAEPPAEPEPPAVPVPDIALESEHEAPMIDEAWNTGFTRFKARWKQARQSIAETAGPLNFPEIPLPAMPNVPLPGVFPEAPQQVTYNARSPLYAPFAKRRGAASPRVVISTEQLRSATVDEDHPALPPDFNQRMEQTRRNLRQNWLFFWGVGEPSTKRP